MMQILNYVIVFIGLATLIYFVFETTRKIENIEKQVSKINNQTNNGCDVCCRDCQDNDVCNGACVHCQKGDNNYD